MAADLSTGILCITSLLTDLETLMKKETYPFYERPIYIYRGIHRYYDGNESLSGDNSHLIKNYTCDEVTNGFIRSALAIRLLNTARKNEECGYIKANYINVLQDMIRDVKRHYPEKYSNQMSDLDILADLQHNGGATCLVDFSKNFLTALWFACSDNPDFDGYIYCYDIMGDMIKNNALTYVQKKDESKSIDELLSQTYKHTNITSDIESRFLIWEPSTRNSRILRQDSVFVFGLEKFEVRNHDIHVIKIKAENKRHILYALRILFNITYKTIYNDSIGYATSNEKSRTIDKLSVNPYQRGYQNMIKGNFDAAADLLKLWEGEKYAELTLPERVELHFSLAVCFKYLYRHDLVHYFENAIIEYKNCIKVIKKLLRLNINTSGFNSGYYCKKAARSYSSIVDILYEAEKYDAASRMCDEIIIEINSGFFMTYKTDTGNRLKDSYCKLTRIELFVLTTISDYKNRLTEANKLMLRNKFDLFVEDMDKSSLTQFELFLLDFYRYVLEVLLSKDGNPEGFQKRMFEWRIKMENKTITISDYNFWNFRDLKKAIDSIDEKKIKDDHIITKKYNMQSITAHAISFRDIYEMQSVGRSKEI